MERKGILDFVELAKRLKEYQFIWFGYTNPSVIPKKIRDAVNTKLPNLTFAGYVPKETIKAALTGCDLYLFPTLEETEGIPIVEACAMKTPALIRDIPVFEEWLEDGKEGITEEFDEFVRLFNENKELFERKAIFDFKTYAVATPKNREKCFKQEMMYADAVEYLTKERPEHFFFFYLSHGKKGRIYDLRKEFIESRKEVKE